MKYNRPINVNSMLSLFNFIVFGLICYGLTIDHEIEKNSYIDRISLLLGLLLCIQTWVLLCIEKKRPDPFVLVLAQVTMTYYSLRIFTIALYPYSIVFDRVGVYSASDSNFSLCIIFFANAFLAAGLFSHQFKSAIKINNVRPTQPMLPLLILCLTVIFNYSNPLRVEGEAARWVDLLFLFLSPYNIILIYAVYIAIYKENIKLFYKIAFIVIALIFLITQTVGGSRSGLLTYFNYLFFLTIVIMPYFTIKMRSLAIGIVALPASLLIMGLLFVIATTARSTTPDQNLNFIQQVEAHKNTILTTDHASKLDSSKSLIFARVGYFDFTSEIIAHRKEYSELFTLESYVMSVIDNVLTPGFDFFDYPKIGNGLSQIYYQTGSLSKKSVAESYQSDQISLIAELFVLFGYFSFFILFIIGRFFKIMYSASNNISQFNLALKRVFLVITFYFALLSFGLDWLLLESILLAFTMILIKSSFRVRETLNK